MTTYVEEVTYKLYVIKSLSALGLAFTVAIHI